MVELKVPMFPESVADGTLAQWNKSEGDFVNEGDILAEIETDKVVLEVPATASGVLKGIKKQAGDTVLSEESLAIIDTAASTTEPKQQTTNQENTSQATASDQEMDVKAPVFPESVADGTVSEWHKKEGEAVSEGDILAEIETDKVVLEVPATSNGVLTKILKPAGDTVLSAEVIAKITTGAAAPAAAKPEAAVEASQTNNDPHLVPSARKAFNASGLDSAVNIEGTGKKGRITSEDVKKAATSVNKPQQFTALVNQGARYEKRVKMTRLRQTIANRLVEVQHTNAILTTFNEVDMSAVMELRNKYKDMFVKEHDTKLGFMSFFIKAATEALKKFPDVNASIDGDEIIYHNYFDIGIAVGTDRGLVVPVLRDTDTKSLAELEADVLDKAIKGRDGKLGLEDMQGGTFTITNGGTYGSMLSTPIINSPQSAILGMHNIVERPVVVKGEIKIRPIMYLALSYDHRIIDGGTSVRFLKTIKELIEDPNRILLQV
ncbi:MULTISPECIES: 2-oxoglutarate dehydrogenase complex dihydrolipoyllysine-residue succinyltransferase [Francisella]|uniref:Dihydrolipoyllysine-residue succinyltransferase component of 2-oxoglutarate dehydrogenase complex n=1 Tax=Francisella opportunistica TaxID=2016517 RepID=A0A345JT82_9GAMM|nr:MULTISPECIES: 2-oxoglutarate dehydrogenase complex dihydrolipoyllysine-residue succinyltransferase [Francisella]APC92321.1 Dihydrolipoamide succinyltransferase component (E2) of 2-oxoglutarate dehydrogenase complex [Francisella sp. MA067296]AXH30528.1 2-oxoglutarate dehydrogenase complex dihydrolipoyllysine-residue succinyltransferase [Francisella opportunistica]AXH32169.1 dihydrolipoamide succinyltransferase [Francisella opportunistica]AXH33818.1 dihydrolipoamide succinyltransferase [Franci